MEKTNIEKAKDLFIYAPLGAFGFVKDNAPTFFTMFVNRGKRDASNTNLIPDEKVAQEVQARGEEVAGQVVVGAMKVNDFVESSIRNLADQIDISDIEQNDAAHKITEDEVRVAFDESKITKQDVEHAFAASGINGIINHYEILSAPEIIGKLDMLSHDDLKIIVDFEKNFRDRKTIIHAANYQLNSRQS